MYNTNQISLCNGENHDYYIDIGIKGLEPYIIYISISLLRYFYL